MDAWRATECGETIKAISTSVSGKTTKRMAMAYISPIIAGIKVRTEAIQGILSSL